MNEEKKFHRGKRGSDLWFGAMNIPWHLELLALSVFDDIEVVEDKTAFSDPTYFLGGIHDMKIAVQLKETNEKKIREEQRVPDPLKWLFQLSAQLAKTTITWTISTGLERDVLAGYPILREFVGQVYD